MSSIHEALRQSAIKHASLTAFNILVDDKWRSITYAGLYGMSQAAAAALSEAGVTVGSRVAILSPNRVQWCASYWGALIAGSVVVPMDVKLTPDEVRNLLVDSSSQVIVTSGDAIKTAQDAIEGLPAPPVLLDMDRMDWATPAAPAKEAKKVGDDLAALLYTSGTTGAPKAVMLSHGNIVWDARALIDSGILIHDDNILAVLPLHHTYAFMGTFIVPVMLGAQITYPAGLKGPDIVAAAKATGGTVLVSVPLLLELLFKRMTEKLGALPYGLSGVMGSLVKFSSALRTRTGFNLMGAILKPLGGKFRFFASGGARLDPAVMQGLEALGLTVVEGYGLTETSPAVTFNPLDKRKPGSVGVPLPQAEVRILNPSESGEGEIAIKGPMVMKGYYKKPIETAQVLQDGWFKSGDLGYIDPEGFLYITGRIKEVIVLPSGKNVYPEEVERHYGQLALVRELCVMDQMGKLHAVIVPDMEYAREQKIGNITEALKWDITRQSSTIPPHMRVMGFSISIEPLPRTPLGKLRRFMIKATVVDRSSATDEQAALIKDPLGATLVECIKPFIDAGVSVRPSDNLELDLGIDSLKRVELSVSIESAFGIKLPEGVMSEVHTVSELLSRIRLIGEGPASEPPAISSELGALDAILSRPPSEDIKRASGAYRSSVAWALIVVPVLGAVKLYFRLFYGLKAHGIERLPRRPYIAVSNHASYYDAFVVGSAIPFDAFKHTYFQGERKYFEHGLGSFIARMARVIAIDPDGKLGGALQMSSHAIREGEALFIFPEGGRSFDGGMMSFRKGLGILAHRLGVPVVPIRIHGTYEAWSRHDKWPKGGSFKVVIGEPVAPPEIAANEDQDAAYQRYADMVQKKVEEL